MAIRAKQVPHPKATSVIHRVRVGASEACLLAVPYFMSSDVL